MSVNEDKIKKAFKQKTWNEIKSSDSWQIFKIMAEFVDPCLARPEQNLRTGIINWPKRLHIS